MKNYISEKLKAFLLIAVLSGSAISTMAQDSTVSNGRQVTLIKQLSGSTENYKNKLEWATANEVNNFSFTLERSNDASTFERLAIVRAAGTSTSQTNYIEYDAAPYNGITYYRLKQTDVFGAFSYSPIISINNYHGEVTVSTFPNPVGSNLNLSFYAPKAGVANICIYNYAGQIVLKTNELLSEGNTLLNTDLSAFAEGIYTVVVTGSDFENLRSVTKIIKN